MLDWVVQNKELIKILYALIVVIICAIIVVKTDRLFRLSLHTGIRYFRNAFLFFGLGFFTRFFICSEFCAPLFGLYHPILRALFEYFLIMGGFFLLYSLLWKRFEPQGIKYHSSLMNSKIAVFYLMALVIVFLDYLWGTFYLMFGSQILLFAFASIVSFIKYREGKNQHRFLKFYFIAMLLSLAAWVLNALAGFILDWNPMALVIIYLLNIIIFLLFLYGVVRVTNRGS